MPLDVPPLFRRAPCRRIVAHGLLLREGGLQVLASGGTSLVYERRSHAERVLVVINYGSAHATLSLSGLPAGLHYDAVLAHGTAATDWVTPVDGRVAAVSAPARSIRLLRASP